MSVHPCPQSYPTFEGSSRVCCYPCCTRVAGPGPACATRAIAWPSPVWSRSRARCVRCVWAHKLICTIHLLRSMCVTQIPDHDHWRRVALLRRHEMQSLSPLSLSRRDTTTKPAVYVIGMLCHVTHAPLPTHRHAHAAECLYIAHCTSCAPLNTLHLEVNPQEAIEEGHLHRKAAGDA